MPDLRLFRPFSVLGQRSHTVLRSFEHWKEDQSFRCLIAGRKAKGKRKERKIKRLVVFQRSDD